MSRSCRAFRVRVVYERRIKASIYLAYWLFTIAIFSVYSNHAVAPDIWHDSVGDYFNVSWGGESNLLF